MRAKYTLSIDMTEFRTMRNLMIRVQGEARAIRNLQKEIPKLKEQLSEAKGIFKGKERKSLTEQMQQTAEAARKRERSKQAQTVAGAGQTAKSTKEIL